MRRVRQYAERRDLAVFERIIELYGPYVLVRCASYTNSRPVSQQIGAYVLVCTCLMLRKLDRPGQIGILVEVMLEVVARDVVSACGQPFRTNEPEEPFLADVRMRRIAAALNRLDRPVREVVVLHHLGGMAVRELAGFLQKPRGEVQARLEQGRGLLAQWLDGLCAEEVGPSLTDFAAGLDAGWIVEVGECAMAYLTRETERPRRSSGREWN